MTIKYIGEPPDEDGIFLVRVDGELTVAEVRTSANEEPTWIQIGIDYDCWSYSSATIEVEAIVKLNLEMIEQVAKQGYYFLAKVEEKPN